MRYPPYLHPTVTASVCCDAPRGEPEFGATALSVQEFDKGRGPVGFPPIGQACDLPVEPDGGPREGSLVKFRGGRSARCRCSLVMVALVWGVAESAACPLMTAGFCERAGHAGRRAGGFGAVNVVQRFGLVAFLCGVISRGGRGQEQPALPRSAGHRRCPGDKMIDWVSPPAGMRPLSLIRPSAWPCQARAAAADSGSAGAGRGGPHRVSSAAVCPAGAGVVTGWSPWR
jgi:hypothetical protein